MPNRLLLGTAVTSLLGRSLGNGLRLCQVKEMKQFSTAVGRVKVSVGSGPMPTGTPDPSLMTVFKCLFLFSKPLQECPLPFQTGSEFPFAALGHRLCTL